MKVKHGFNKARDVERVLRMLDKFESSQTKATKAKNFVRQEARYARITDVLDPGPAVSKNKEGMGIAVKWDEDLFDWVDITENPALYDNDLFMSADATIFSARNISSKSAMAVNDIVFLQYYPALSETSDWLVVETGGGSRAYVVITSVTDAANYIGDVIVGPNDPTILTADVEIKVQGATANEFEVGYSNFSDVVNEIHYLNGGLLG